MKNIVRSKTAFVRKLLQTSLYIKILISIYLLLLPSDTQIPYFPVVFVQNTLLHMFCGALYVLPASLCITSITIQTTRP